jgi:hypothetical protein
MAQTNLATFGQLDRDYDTILSVAGTKADVFDALRKDGVGAAIWHRDFDSALSDWLDAVSPNDLPNGRILTAIEDLPDAVESLVQTGNLQTGPFRASLAADIVMLAQRFAVVGGADCVDIRLEAVTTNACRRYHYDQVPLRLVATYRGPGTQLVPHEYRDRALADQIDYDGPLRELPRYSAAIFRGVAGNAQGVLHRSPPIEGTDQARLLLCLNVPTVVSPPIWRRGGECAQRSTQ